ncbi:RNA polymerase factor sigma-54 [Bdellovibrio sp. HCB2-146]|uniref:RNA polymerase factor sigma-54 n=1 Tax=Bdellovibrio sp. HCB2-146 TaxID=3394362 RepID=UPI0039BC246D
MALRQTMNLSQSLVITPQLQQAIKLLQMSRMELESAVRSELEENPILEEAEVLKEDDLQRTKEAASEVEGGEGGQDQVSQDPQKQDEFEWESYIEANQKPPQSGMAGSEEIMNYENVITASQTLHDHLYWQVKMTGFSGEEEQAADALIGYIDDDGYIKVPLEQIAEEEKIDLGLLEDTLTLIHEFDPPGVGARNLKECLLIQAKHLEEDTHDLVNLINNHLKDLEKKNYEAIAKALGRDVEDIIEICKIIYAMAPYPGRAFVSSDTHYVTPDVYVYKVGEDYVVSLNEDGLPRLKISNFYKNMLKGGKTTGDKTQDYIQEKLRSAVWLIKSIHQRQRTIYKVSESIVKHQREFFEKGPEHLKPMVLRDVANDIGMHESTVSRVTTAKYMHTPQGIYELKYFFNSGISSSDGDALASESVKLKIKDLVAKEDPKNPLSDQKIVDMLKVDGIQIARRTVAKYRDMLKILPSSQRKKYF